MPPTSRPGADYSRPFVNRAEKPGRHAPGALPPTVGPRSAGAQPGPACYQHGGILPTVTDAALLLGFIDPDFFLGGAIRLDRKAAETALRTHLAEPLGFDVIRAASAVIDVVTENMVQAIVDVTVAQGVDPAEAVLICEAWIDGLLAGGFRRFCVQAQRTG